jgi:hypothetical protein
MEPQTFRMEKVDELANDDDEDFRLLASAATPQTTGSGISVSRVVWFRRASFPVQRNCWDAPKNSGNVTGAKKTTFVIGFAAEARLKSTVS